MSFDIKITLRREFWACAPELSDPGLEALREVLTSYGVPAERTVVRSRHDFPFRAEEKDGIITIRVNPEATASLIAAFVASVESVELRDVVEKVAIETDNILTLAKPITPPVPTPLV